MRKGSANSNARARVSKDEDGTDLGFTRDRQNSEPKSATADLGALMLRDASQRRRAVDTSVLAWRCDAPQHEGAAHFGQAKPRGGAERKANLRLWQTIAGCDPLFADCYLQ
jgi:hypothetical protein